MVERVVDPKTKTKNKKKKKTVLVGQLSLCVESVGF